LKVFRRVLKQLREETQRKQWERAKAIAKKAHSLSPVDTGRHAASITVTDNLADLRDYVDEGATGGPDICKFKQSPKGKAMVYYVGARVPYAAMLEHGTYPDPGQPHWSPKPIGIVVRKTPSGFMVIRTTDEGFSNRASTGVIEAAFRMLEDK